MADLMNPTRVGILGILLSFSFQLQAAPLSRPDSDPNFLTLRNGKSLKSVTVSGSGLFLATGSGYRFGDNQQAAYQKLKTDSQTIPGHGVQWVFMDLDSHHVIAESLESNRKIFGASSSKVFVAAALVDQQQGDLSSSQLSLMASMLVVSSNSAWTDLQRQIGDGNSNTGRERIHNFTQKMGYDRTRGFQGYWGDVHGNELTAAESAKFLHDSYQDLYPGAETVWKIMHTCRTGTSRGRKYIPESIFVGGKTGTYAGQTVDPETGKSTFPNGKPYTVDVRNHLLVFSINGKQYGLSILANSGSDESAALLAGGLIREYAGVQSGQTH